MVYNVFLVLCPGRFSSTVLKVWFLRCDEILNPVDCNLSHSIPARKLSGEKSGPVNVLIFF